MEKYKKSKIMEEKYYGGLIIESLKCWPADSANYLLAPGCKERYYRMVEEEKKSEEAKSKRRAELDKLKTTIRAEENSKRMRKIAELELEEERLRNKNHHAHGKDDDIMSSLEDVQKQLKVISN